MTTYQQAPQPWQDISSKTDTTASYAPGYMTANRKLMNATLNDITERAFRAWVNNVLLRSNKISSPIGHLGTALSGPTGGLLLLRLFEALLKSPADPNVWKFHESPRNSWEGLENYEIAFEFFNRFKPSDFEVSSYGTHIPERHRFVYDSKELYDGNLKDILGLVFELIDFFGVRPALGHSHFHQGKHLSMGPDEQRKVQSFFEDVWGYERGASPLSDAEKDQFFNEFYGFKPSKWESVPVSGKEQKFYEEVKPVSRDIYEEERKDKKKLRKKPYSSYSTSTSQGIPSHAFSDVNRDTQKLHKEHTDIPVRSRDVDQRIPVHSEKEYVSGRRPQEYSTFMSDKDRTSSEIKSVLDRYRSDLEQERANSDLKFREFITITERLRQALDKLSATHPTTATSKGFESPDSDKKMRKEVLRLRGEMNDLMRQFSGSMEQRNTALEREIDRLKSSFERMNHTMAAPRGGEGKDTSELIAEIQRAKKDLKRDKKLLEALSEENRRLVEENRRRNMDIQSVSSNLQQRLWELERKLVPGAPGMEAESSRHIHEAPVTHRKLSSSYPQEYDIEKQHKKKHKYRAEPTVGYRPEEFSRDIHREPLERSTYAHEAPIDRTSTYGQQSPLSASYSRDIPTSSRMASEPAFARSIDQPRDISYGQQKPYYPSEYGRTEPSMAGTHFAPGVAQIYKAAPAIVPPHSHAFQDVPPEYFDRTPTYSYRSATAHHRVAGTDVADVGRKVKEGATKLMEKGKEKLSKNLSSESLSDKGHKTKHKGYPGSPKLEKRVEKLEHQMHKHKDHDDYYVREVPVTTIHRSTSLPSVHSYLLPPTTAPVTYVRSRSLYPATAINPIGTLAVIPYEVSALPGKLTRPHFDVSLSSQVLALPYPFGAPATTTTTTSDATTSLPIAAPLVFNVLSTGQLLIIELLGKGRTGGVGKKVWGRAVIPLTFIRPDDAKASLDGWFPIEAPWVGGTRAMRRKGDNWSVRRWMASKEGREVLDTRDEYAVTERIRRYLKDIGGTGYKTGKNVGGVVGRERGSIRLRIEFNKFLNRENIVEVGHPVAGERVVERRLIEEEVVEKPRKVKRRRSLSTPVEREVIVTERDVPVTQVMSGYGGYGAGYGTVAYDSGTVYDTIKTEPVVTRDTYLTRARGPTLVRTEVVRPEF